MNYHLTSQLSYTWSARYLVSCNIDYVQRKINKNLASKTHQGMAKWQQCFENGNITWTAISTSLCVESPSLDSFTFTKMVFHHILELGHQFTVQWLFFLFWSFLITHDKAKIRWFTLNPLISPQTRYGRHNHSGRYTTTVVFSPTLDMPIRILQ